MNIFQFMTEAGLSGVGLLAFFFFRDHGRLKKLEARVEVLEKDAKLLAMLETSNQKQK